MTDRKFPAALVSLGLGVLATSALAATGSYTNLGFPSELITSGRIFGWSLATILFLLLLRGIRSGVTLTLRWVLVSALLLAAPFFLAQPIFAGDLYAYVANAKVSAIGNPYVLTPSSLGDDPILQGVVPVWQTRPSAYGPLWTLMSRGLTGITTNSVALATIFRLFALAGILVCAWIIAKSTSPMHAALIALNPIVLVESVGDGHYDILVGLAVLAAVAWLRRPVRSAFALAGATALKFVPFILAPVLIASGKSGQRRAVGAWLAIAVVSLLVVSFTPFWVGTHTFDGLRQQASYFSHPVFFPQFLIFIFAYLGGSAVHPEVLARNLGFFAFLIVYAWTYLAAWRQRLAPATAVAIVLAAYIGFAAPYVQTWYLLWLLPVLTLLPTRQAARWTGAVSVVWGSMVALTVR